MAQIFQRQHLAAALLASGLLVIAAYSAVTLAERRQGDASGAYAEASSLRRRLFGDTTTEAAQQQSAKLPAAFLPSQQDTGSNPPGRMQTRIINGKRASPDDFAFMVALLLNGQLMCGGTLLDATTVLTAAHCVVDTGLVDDPSGLTVYTVNGTQIPVEAAYANPEYDPNKIPEDNISQSFRGNLHDVAVLKLAEPVVDPVTITLANSSTTLERGEQLQVAGFGTTESGQPSNFLEYAEVDFNAAGRCALEEYTDVLCAGGTGQNTCNGDSGGPLLIRDPDTGEAVQIGITSHGPECPSGPVNAYGYYTDVRKYEDVIAALQAENFTALPPMPSPQPVASPGGIGDGIGIGTGSGSGSGSGSGGAAGGVPGGSSGSNSCLASLDKYGSGVALEGGDLSRGSFIASQSPEECCRICSAVSACWAWTWSSADDKICGGPCCVLKQLQGYVPVYSPDSESGAWFPQQS